MIHQLVYASRSRIPGPPDAVAWTIKSIVGGSRRRNALLGVTGAMMFHDGWFGQALEGAADAVLPLFERIARDERHEEVAVLASRPVASRSFGNWSMALVGAASGHPLRRPPADIVNWDRCGADGDEMLRTLLHFFDATERVCG